MSGFCSLHIALRAADFFLGTPHSGVGTGQFGGEFRNFEDRECLPFLHVRANVDVHGLDVAGDFGVEVDFLKGLEASRQRQRSAQGPAPDLDDSRDGRASVLGIVGAIGFGFSVAKEYPRKAALPERPEPRSPEIFFVCHTFSCLLVGNDGLSTEPIPMD